MSYIRQYEGVKKYMEECQVCQRNKSFDSIKTSPTVMKTRSSMETFPWALWKDCPDQKDMHNSCNEGQIEQIHSLLST